MKLLGNTENKITKDKNSKNVRHLEITEEVLVHCDTVNNYYQQDSRVFYTFVPNKILQQIISFKKDLTQNMMKLKHGSQIKTVSY